MANCENQNVFQSQPQKVITVAILSDGDVSRFQNTFQNMFSGGSESFTDELHVFRTFDEALAYLRDHAQGVFFIPTSLLRHKTNRTILQKMSLWMPQVKWIAFDETNHYTQAVVDLINQNVLFWKLNLNTSDLEVVLTEVYEQQISNAFENQQSSMSKHSLSKISIWQSPPPETERELFHLVNAASINQDSCWQLPVLMKHWAIAVGGEALECDQAFWFAALSQVDLSRFWNSRVDLSIKTLGWLISVFYEGRAGRWLELFQPGKTPQKSLALPVPLGSPPLLQDEEMAQVLRWFSQWLSASEPERQTLLLSGENWFTQPHWKCIQDILIQADFNQAEELAMVFDTFVDSDLGTNAEHLQAG